MTYYIYALIFGCGLITTETSKAQPLNESLFESVKTSDTSKLKELIRKGANVNYEIQSWSWRKTNLLNVAVTNQDVPSTKILLKNGADIHWRDGESATAIIHAAYTGNREMIEFLLVKGANILDYDRNGITVLIAAEKYYNKDLMTFLEEQHVMQISK